MVYTILISIVFIAELIIAITIIQNLIKFDNKILSLNTYLSEIKPSIADVSNLSKKISGQMVILSQDFIDKTKENSEDILCKYLSKLLISLLIISLNFKVIKQIRKSQITRILAKGWSFVENMV